MAVRPGARVRGDETRQRILDVAASLFLERGYHGTSVKEIASGVGVSVAALYYFFDSKEEIYVSFIQEALKDFREEIVKSIGTGPAPKRLRRFVRTFVLGQLADRRGASAYEQLYSLSQLLSEISEDRRERLVSGQREMQEALRGILLDGEREGNFTFENVKVAAFALTSACEYVFEWYEPSGELSPPEVADQYADLCEAMVTAR